ncbi:MAG: TonB-dependent receptor plug domain-containing protein, partial [Deltaproteobacteria bacterium]|nr:TonB-dependent receptor plug domain-containing protein [Deltaproteobacteria bacterium]
MKTKNKQLKIKQVTLLIAGIFSGSAYAQTEAPTEVTVVVTGLRAGIERNLDDKRKAVNGLEVISSTDIGKFPDTNLSESLQRIPGVTIIRSETGEGKQVNIRGL